MPFWRSARAYVIVALALGAAIYLDYQWSWLVKSLGMPVTTLLVILGGVVLLVLLLAAVMPEPRRPGFVARRRIFFFNCALLAILFGAALVYFCYPIEVWPNPLPKQDLTWLKYALHGVWFGMLGSVAISLKGVADHTRPSDWTETWWVWYLERPFLGALVGVMTYLLFQAANPTGTFSIATLAVVAFLFGTQARRFFNVVTEVSRVLLTTQLDLRGAAIHIVDATVMAGRLVLTGVGFQSGVAVVIGGQAAANPVVAADGRTVTAEMPSVSGTVAVIAMNPDGSAAWYSGLQLSGG